MKLPTKPLPSLDTAVFALRHLESSEYICLQHERNNYIALFTDPDAALSFRTDLGQIEHADIISVCLEEIPTDYFWLDGEMLHRSTFVSTITV